MGTNEAASPSSTLTDRLADEMRRRWRAGDRPLVEDYLAAHAELRDRPESAIELLYEELCLRQECGEEAPPADVLRRFPQWAEQLRALVDCHRLLEGGTAPRFPAPGERLGDFMLLAELGRGAAGRVFLATQPALADRAVVLKLVPRSGEEHLSLARLQHTHIVPLYSAHDEPARGLRALCMPYFGGATLARLLELMRGCPPARRAGGHLLAALRQAQDGAPAPIPVAGPACRFLAQSSYVRAVCWMGACLADALHYSHERGLVHLDVKPSNVLWGADGQPMLLDLHLARGPVSAGGPAPAWLGGTPAYMAPEQRLAVAAVPEGRAVSAAVDRRADVYALGLLLCEALGGALPPPAGAGPWLRVRNARVSAGLADVLGKCLVVAPHDRYPDAAALSDDLRRHLADLPLRGAPNRSLSERWRKWRRRRPHAPALLILALVALMSGALDLAYAAREGHKARAALDEGREHLQRRDYAAARAASRRGLALAEGLPLHGDLAESLRGQLRVADRAEAGTQLNRLVERLRALDGADGHPTAEARSVEALCRALWQRRELIARRLDAPAAEAEQLRADLIDLAVLWSDLRVRLVRKGEVAAARTADLEVLAQAEELLGPNCVIDAERRRHGGAPAGRPAPGPRSAREHYAVGRALFRAGDLKAAEGHLDRALDLAPGDFWATFFKGACAYRLARYEDAVLAFTACLALAPRAAWCYHNRALAYDGLGREDRALGDYDRALRLAPDLAPAALSRGVLHGRAGRHAQALADLQRALDGGAAPAVVNFHRAEAHLARGDRAAALASLERALDQAPDHEPARALADRLRRRR